MSFDVFVVPLGGPTNVSAINSSSTSIEIQWNPVPQSLRLGVITHYIFTITEVLTGNVTMVTFDGAALNGTVGNLSKYTEYSIKGAAVNSKGQSNFTIAITCRTSEDGKNHDSGVYCHRRSVCLNVMRVEMRNHITFHRKLNKSVISR